ncbi:MAG: two pore domain potassium channel family protein, partial [Bacteroidia bacterium]|nr:two pore domain potassium channel family protein [Bacteroidia bacterium]
GYIMICALVMFSVEPESFNTFFDAVYWAVVTLTTVGYGDIYPVTVFGKVISMLSSLIGIAIIALPTGIVAAGYMAALKESKKTKNKNDERKEID